VNDQTVTSAHPLLREVALCILHVGTEKTGSTSLQRFLGMHADRLLERGLFVPSSLTPYKASGNFNHIFLSTASRAVRVRPDDLQRQFGLNGAKAVEEHREHVIAALKSEIEALSRPPRQMLLSNEHIHSRLRTEDDLSRLKSLLGGFCESFRVIVYLRPQHQVAQSIAITAVRGGKTEFRPIPDFSSNNGFDPVLGVDFDYFDYDSLLRRLARVFGDKALDVRLYDRTAMIGGDILEDFFGRIGTDINGLQRPERENSSLDPVASLFLAAVNRHLAGSPALPDCRKFILSYTARARRGSGPSASRSDIQRFMDQFSASNEAVRSRWFPSQKTLFQPGDEATPSHEAVRPFNLSENEIFGMFGELLTSALKGGREGSP
jgi:hypothetical protein